MSPRPTRRRRALAPGIAIAAVALIALLIAGSRDLTVRTATADVPNQVTVTTLASGRSVCEGPLAGQASTRSVGIWGGAAGPVARIAVTARDVTTHAILATGSLRATAGSREWTVRLSHSVRTGVPVQICLRGDAGAFSLAGGAVSDPHVTVTGTPGDQRFSLVLLSDANRSSLGSLSLAFSRASLWRLSWVGSWTFWVLTVALLLTFGLVVLAVLKAADDDDGTPPRRPGPPDGPADKRPSETRQDRPQPVP